MRRGWIIAVPLLGGLACVDQGPTTVDPEELKIVLSPTKHPYKVSVHIENKSRDALVLIRPRLRLCATSTTDKKCYHAPARLFVQASKRLASVVVPADAGVDEKEEIIQLARSGDTALRYVFQAQLLAKVLSGGKVSKLLDLTGYRWSLDEEEGEHILPKAFRISSPKPIPEGKYSLELSAVCLSKADLVGPVLVKDEGRRAEYTAWIDPLPSVTAAFTFDVTVAGLEPMDLFHFRFPSAHGQLFQVNKTYNINFSAFVKSHRMISRELTLLPPERVQLFLADEDGNAEGSPLAVLKDDGKYKDTEVGDWKFSGSAVIHTGDRPRKIKYVVRGEGRGLVPFTSSVFPIIVVPEWVPERVNPDSKRGRVITPPDGKKFRSNQLFLSFKKGTGYDEIKRILDKINGKVHQYMYHHVSDMWIIVIPDTPDGSGVLKAIRTLESESNVSARPNTWIRD